MPGTTQALQEAMLGALQRRPASGRLPFLPLSLLGCSLIHSEGQKLASTSTNTLPFSHGFKWQTPIHPSKPCSESLL